MGNPAPRTTVTLRRSQARINPQDLSGITCWIGTCSEGTVNEMLTLTNVAAMRPGGDTPVGYGEAPSGAAETLGVAGSPVYIVPSAHSTAGTVAAVVKNPNSGGVPTFVGGYILLAGTDANGDIGFQQIVEGVTLVAAAGGALAAVVTGSTGAWTVTLTLVAATASSAVETFWLSGDAGATAARALITATFYGTKASNSGTTIASTLLDDGALLLTAPATGYRYKMTVGNGQALTASYASEDLTIALACNATSKPNGTAALTRTAINAITGKITAELVGTGTLSPGPAPSSFTALQYGSTAVMTLSGDPNDYMPLIRVQTVRGGALGTATIKWCIDGQDSTLSEETLVPSSGIVALTASNFDSGLTATFTGILEGPGAGEGVERTGLGDEWTSSATAPTSSISAILAAMAVAFADPTRKFGVLAIAQELELSEVVQVDSLIQSSWGSSFVEAILQVRDRDLAGAETDAEYVTALNSEFLSFRSAHGLTDLSTGTVLFSDSYTGYTYGIGLTPSATTDAVHGRGSVIPAVARNGSIPPHESLGRVATGQIRSVTGASHDERLNPGLAEKFFTTQTYEEAPGGWYFSGASTTADPLDPAYTEEPWVSLACQVGRIAKAAAFVFTNDTVETVTVPEGNGSVPRGAITVSQAQIIESTVSKPVENFLFKPKTDGRPSANPLPATDDLGNPLRTVTALRNYDAKTTGELRLEVLFSRLGIVWSIEIGINLD